MGTVYFENCFSKTETMAKNTILDFFKTKNPKRSNMKSDKLNTTLRVKLNGPKISEFDHFTAAKRWVEKKRRYGF